jgi:hypothetical protein
MENLIKVLGIIVFAMIIVLAVFALCQLGMNPESARSVGF